MTNQPVSMGSAPRKGRPDSSRRMGRFGMFMFIASQLVPIIVLIDVRYLFVGSYVSSSADQPVALLVAVLMAVSGIMAWTVRGSAIRGVDQVARVKWMVLLGAGALLGVLYQWSVRYLSPGTRYGEVFFTMTGFAVFYLVVGLIALLSYISRVRFVASADDGYWHMEAVSLLWAGISVIWLVVYIVLYLL
ncbi:MAG: hypothetical protein C7B44_11495 [Sulfobacillus thermosulfidooxidans]|uniref:Heme-copper oxidase subunit III family profile domain-containing protein n=1 Tax=Sulfobacillus thermotolerans TaxID=338644 RepID=A0ABM6RR88_9FIRM|nr:hypothetical protein [Sulfobacillus sp. hq2]AUW93844.1 hypothetical protein BXT84_07725 [Sulfobacillus thermotolerans]MCY0908915.1 hypothetical protein [Sulfobacillus thermotolerans]POB11342.1 hypothetical protein CO251_05370 [Sulfobacillus sp. hq2]PSR35964.1 MAG: hypothetical protein C7B44_11495 [Sulfobacillus thermosulfidooxidans]